MIKKILVYFTFATFAFVILFISIFRTAAVKYDMPESSYLIEFNQRVLGESSKVNYTLAYPGKVLPDSPLWSVKAFRDKVWLSLTTNPERKAELLLLFADKRLAASKLLFDDRKFDMAYATLTKAEKYLELSSQQALTNNREGRGSKGFDYTLANAAMKHYEVIAEIINLSAEEMQPNVIRTQDLPIGIYKDAKNSLSSTGDVAPDNPFNWD